MMLALILAWVSGIAQASATHSWSPSIVFSFDTGFDQAYCDPRRYPIQDAWVREGMAAVPVVQKTWDRFGTPLISATTKLIGIPFDQRDVRATLFLCAYNPMMANPMLINLGPVLAGPTGGHPQDLYLLLELTYHEFLHNYLNSILPRLPAWPTPLYRKYVQEHPDVRDHLHLVAIETVIYSSLKFADRLKLAREVGDINGKDYQRAWQIVDQEGAQRFVEELRR